MLSISSSMYKNVEI